MRQAPDAPARTRAQITERTLRTGPAAEGAPHHRGAADDLGGLRHDPRARRPLVLRDEISLPDAVLLAVRQRRVRGGAGQPGALVRRGAAGHPVRGGLAAVRARLPAVLLPLPARLLPGVLAGGGGVGRGRRARGASRTPPAPARPGSR